MANRMLLASHGRLAEGMHDALEVILGARADVVATSPYRGDLEQVRREAEAALADTDDLLLIVTDIAGGSVHNELASLVLDERVRLVAGMSLPLVLELAIALPALPVDGDLRGVLDAASAAIAELDATVLATATEDEEL